MGVATCCCCSSKDAAITIGIWSLVSSIAQLGIMGWQMVAIKYERDRAANTLLPNYNTYGRFDVPSYYESYWQSPEERYYTGLFVIQVLCLIAAFFLLFASAALIYGIHTWSKYLVWPWFPCMISSILSSLAYCIMWWAGDVRDYWLAITIIEIIIVFINIYCVVIVMVYYRRINSTTDVYEGKDRRGVRYKINRNGTSRRDLLESYEGINRSPSPKYPMPYKPLAQPYPVYPTPYSAAGVPQTPLPLPATHANTPYPLDPNEVKYMKEPKSKRSSYADDPVSSWVREQQSLDRSNDVNSEPIAISKQVHPTTLQHSRSVPSLYDGTLVSHRDCDHSRHHRRSSRRRKSRSRHGYESYSSDTEPTATDFTRAHRHRSSSRRRHRSRPKYDESITNYDSDAERERRRSKRHRHGSTRSHREHRRDRDRDRDRERDRDRRRAPSPPDSQIPAKPRSRHHRESSESKPDSDPMAFPLSGGITIPQHIVIPPSSGERGPDGQPIPQKYQINSEITINYDQNGRPMAQPIEEPYRRRQPIQSTF
ncbi:unnamed protein product [Caenorhabditis bovis]|uniref:Uncharacterized protein n=1 Tax=Caenorhabditis bovis TaxID=2654633 RepID=A0A8S1EL78_9PELO|nr:unnamed protein product [Caenorhabditis bovis]